MTNEKMMILKMLEEGKISAEEASRLLEAAGKSQGTGSSTAPTPDFNNNASFSSAHRDTSHTPPVSDYGSSQQNNGAPKTAPGSYRPNPSGMYPPGGSGSYSTNNNGGSRPSAPAFEGFAEDLGRKFDTFVKDFEPTLQKITGIVVEKTAAAADKISKSLETPRTPPVPPRPAGHPASAYSSSGTKGYERSFELKVMPGHNELNISGLNAPVLIKGYNGDKINARVLCVPKVNNPRIELVALGGKYFLDYDEDHFEKVSIDAFVPEGMFKNINMTTYNGDLRISTVKAGFINLYSTNGDVEVNNIYAVNLKVECENGKNMKIMDVVADNAQIENFNGNINAYNIDAKNLKMVAFNGPLTLNMTGFNSYDDYVWVLETSNQKLNVNLPSAYGVGYYLKAQTSLGALKIGLTGLNYLFNNKNMVEAKTIEYDTLPKKIKLSLETSNAQLTVN